MNWAALRHLCWVLLVLGGVSGVDEEQSSRPTAPVRPRRPVRRNSIKKSSEEDFKPSVFQGGLSTTTASPRFSTKRANVVDDLARNTVPVVSVTETSRKPYRPPPVHLLTYQALSSTERGSDRTNEPNIVPTGWALASLGPPSRNVSSISKKNHLPLGTTRPLTSYWSTRLRRPPGLRTTPLPPADGEESSKDAGGVGASATSYKSGPIPAENLIKDEKNVTASHPKLPGDSQESTLELAPASERENVQEKPFNVKKLAASSTTQAFEATTDNTRNNLIKELRGGDIGSKILHGIVAVTNASEYSDEEKRGTSTQSVESVRSQKPQDEANDVDEKVKLVTKKTEYGTKSNFGPISTAAVGVETSSQAMTASSIITSPAEAFASSGEQNNHSTSPVTASIFHEEIAPTATPILSKETAPVPPSESFLQHSPLTSTESSSTALNVEWPRETGQSEMNSEHTTVMENSTDRMSSIPEAGNSNVSNDTRQTKVTDPAQESSQEKTLEKHSVSTPLTTVAETEAAITASVPDSSTTLANTSLQPPKHSAVNKSENTAGVQQPTTLSSVPESVTTATSVSLEANDIPEAYTREKNNPYVEKSSSGSPDDGFLHTSTPISTKATTKHLEETSNQEPSVSTSEKSTTSSESPKSTSELVESGVPTTTEAILETTTSLKAGKIDTENDTVTTWKPQPATDTSQEEVTSSSNVDISPTTVRIPNQTTAQSVSTWSNPLITESAGNLEETTTGIPVPHHNNTPSSTEYVHVGLSEKPYDDHDDTLKYNVTTIDHAQGNWTDPEESDEEPDDVMEKEGDVRTTTTLVIIEEITSTVRPTTARPTTTTVSEPPPSTTSRDVDQDVPSSTTGRTPASSNEPRLRLTFQASFKEMCLVRESLAETIAAYFKSASSRPIEQSQVKILNLGMSECSSKSLSLTQGVPVFVQITDTDGKGNQNLTNSLYTYIKQSPFNFKYPLANVDHGLKPLLLEESNQWGGTVIAAIVISSVAGVSLLCLTILLVIMRKRQKGFTYGQRCTPVSLEDYSLDNISVFNSVRRKAMRASKRSYGNPAFDDPVTVTNPLSFVGLSNIANSHQKIDNEYSELPTVTVKPDELPPGAECKNRYANVIPIPESRVPLRGPDGEDLFINANYVKGVRGAEKFYIACQAPLESTIADFWMMIWEQQSQVILMLTDLHENGVEKCADYLPPSEVLDCHRVFGDLQVTLKKREVREKYIISSLQLRNLESNLWREVIHLWYTGWPIRGVPDDLASIIAYLIEARSYSKPGHPIVVHCSPGTGRTGTVIAIDIAIRDFETDRTVDIPKTVYGIRRDRAGAVQTNLQYYMIYQVVHLYATKLMGGSLDSI